MKAYLRRVVLASAVLAVLPVCAAERSDIDRLIACADERNDTRRLACYDNAVATVKRASGEASAAVPTATERSAVTSVPTPAPVTPATAVDPESEFGVEGSTVARQRRSEQAQQVKDEIKSISAVVTAVSSRPRGELIITLDNGQTWLQKNAERAFSVKLGDKVTIDAGLLGSFRMSNGKRMTQVTRLK